MRTRPQRHRRTHRSQAARSCATRLALPTGSLKSPQSKGLSGTDSRAAGSQQQRTAAQTDKTIRPGRTPSEPAPAPPSSSNSQLSDCASSRPSRPYRTQRTATPRDKRSRGNRACSQTGPRTPPTGGPTTSSEQLTARRSRSRPTSPAGATPATPTGDRPIEYTPTKKRQTQCLGEPSWISKRPLGTKVAPTSSQLL
jgi:hypothetical protein